MKIKKTHSKNSFILKYMLIVMRGIQYMTIKVDRETNYMKINFSVHTNI